VRGALDDAFSFLAGNALGRDKKGRAIKDDMETQVAAGGEEYSPYVCYEFEIN
jgi:V-type H+-transporting ATPase subunit C